MEMDIRARPILHVLILTKTAAYREALVATLERGHSVAACGRSFADFGDLTSFDAIIVDVADGEGLRCIAQLRSRACSVPVVALGVQSSAAILHCAEAGAAGYVPASASVQELVSALNDVVQGRLVCSPALTFALFRSLGESRPGHRALLTLREQEVFRLLGEGRTNKEIARTLGIAVSTVKNHVHHILEKTAASTRREVAQIDSWELGRAQGRAPEPAEN